MQQGPLECARNWSGWATYVFVQLGTRKGTGGLERLINEFELRGVFRNLVESEPKGEGAKGSNRNFGDI